MMREFIFLLVVRFGRVRVLLLKSFVKQRGEGIPLVSGDVDEAPWMQLAVIGDAGRDGEHALELGRGRPGPDKLARLCRAAGFEQRESRGTVVEHLRAEIGAAAGANNPLHKRILPATVAARAQLRKGREPDGRYASR